MSPLHRQFRFAALAALATFSLGVLLAPPAIAQSAGCNWKDPANSDSDLAQKCGPATGLEASLNEPSNPPPASFTAWYNTLDEQDRHRLIGYMAKKGITDEYGDALSEAEFATYLPFFDSQIRKQAKTDHERAAAFLDIQNETGIEPNAGDADMGGLADFGMTGATGPRSDLDTGK